MITYKFNTDKKYEEEIIKHLDLFSKPIVGEQVKESKFFYLHKEHLTGAANVYYNWNWVMLLNMFFENVEVLQDLIESIKKEFYGRAEGIHLRTYDIKLVNTLLKYGFKVTGRIQPDTKYLPMYMLDLYDLEAMDINCTATIQDEVNSTYQMVLDNKGFLSTRLDNVPESIEDISIIAFEDGSFIGGLIGEVNSSSLHVDLLVVAEEYRGKGIGLKLLQLAEEKARTFNVKGMDLTTSEFQARNFYETFGFKVVYTKKNHPKGFEDYKMIKQLTY